MKIQHECDECAGTGVELVVWDTESGVRQSWECDRCGGSGIVECECPAEGDS